MIKIADNRLIFSILLLGLILRLLWLFLIPGNFIPSSDDYDLIAQNIIKGDGFSIHPPKPTAERMPIYPLFLVSLYKIFGRNIQLVCTFQAFIDMITCFIIYKTALMIFKTKKIANFTAFLYSIYIPYFTLVGVIMNEILFNLVFSIFIYYYFKFYRTMTSKTSLLIGFLLGLSTMIRETPFMLLPLLIITPLFEGLNLKKCLRLGIFSILGFTVIYGPWFIRNTITFKRLVILSTHSGYNLYTNYYFPLLSEGQPLGVLDLETHSKLLEKTEVDMDKELMRRAIKIMKENPGHSLKIFMENFLDFWFNLSFFNEKRYIRYYPVGGEMFSFSYTILFFNGFIITFAILGVSKLRSKWTFDFTLLLAFIAYFNLLHMFFICYVRHSMPIIPYMMMFASFYLTSRADRTAKCNVV
ncbi:glycosyltransferase family 39 protein [bacterium]|nr:glycosyltransferase family 39 protein [bacterium]